ncbi:hypothetical protein [Flavobacterium frigidarium]|uniref:SGNH/GDSL hydrolase family protein n=1 Tax=Flavobacterium frigidarium TaxID=99286 RepID=A0ABV4KCP3_9FLAO
MKSFLIFIVKIVLITVLLAVVLDYSYTAVYLNSKSRDKVSDVFKSKARSYDVVILGSSRANNHFVTRIFEKNGLKTFNYGMSGGHLYEASLLLKLMIERNYEIKTLILEADLNLSNDKQSEGVAAKFLPYIHRSEIIKNHFEQELNFNELYYIPFYRYLKFDSKIGSRELFNTIIQKKTVATENGGYYALGVNKKGNMKNNIVSLNPLKRNKYYEEIKQLCKANNIHFIPIMTPMCENVIGMNYFEKVKSTYPEIHNYENVVIENKYFSSCGHMNDNGARKFTSIIVRDFFKK